MQQDFRHPSPFRYPGAKQALAPYISRFLQSNGINRPHFYEPFAGGASLSLSLLATDEVASVTLVERDPLVYAFWKMVRRDPTALCHRLWRLPITVATWTAFQRYLADDALERFPLIDCAVAGIFFNRVNFSGVIAAKPIGGMDQSSDYAITCRWNIEALVDKICALARHRSRLRVCHSDAVTFLRRSATRIRQQATDRQALVYVDPPYYLQGPKLYRHHFADRHHAHLAGYLNGCGLPWLCSYDNHPRIHELFAGGDRKIIPISLQYTVRRNRVADELLITNLAALPTVDGAPAPDPDAFRRAADDCAALASVG
jgi:DNA adenine methylase